MTATMSLRTSDEALKAKRLAQAQSLAQSQAATCCGEIPKAKPQTQIKPYYGLVRIEIKMSCFR